MRVAPVSLALRVIAAFLLTTVAAVCSDAAVEQPRATDPGWPRVFTDGDASVTFYQPQLEEWTNYQRIRFRCAISVVPQAGQPDTFGVADYIADTIVDHQTRTVTATNPVRQLRFPNLSDADEAHMRAVVDKVFPLRNSLTISLDRVLAYLDTGSGGPKEVSVNLNPPKIFYSAKPAILVIFLGRPEFKPVTEGSPLLFAVNTNWNAFYDTGASRYYLLNGESWLATADVVGGPWTRAHELPKEFSNLPAGDDWNDVRPHVPGKPGSTLPVVFTATEPAEIILTNGAPSFSPIAATKLLQIRNTDSTLFKNSGDNQFYYLVAGRWFRAASLEGPWSAATTDLPEDFRQIPDDDPAAYVKASVPGTREANDALLFASIPTTNTVSVGDDAELDIAYDGPPQFDDISGAPGVEYAGNTPNNVFLVEGRYYTCSQGVWYVSATATGPWSYATEVPPEIYSIPASHPAHNVTYVTVQNTTPSTVTYGYTSGYDGYYASQGVLMFGAGMLLGAAIADDDDHHHHYHDYPSYYSYGSGAVYHHGYGGYYHGASAYGPYGGAGRSGWYDPHSGAWSRSASRYGPNGAAYARSGYNPYTDTYGARASATTRYGSASRYYAERDGEAVRGGHRSNAQGSVRWAQGSEGQAAIAARGRYDQGVVARNKDGNVYVGNDGNVYKRNDEGNWQKRQGGEWQDYDRSTSANAARTRSSTATTSRSTSSARSSSTVDRSRTRTASTTASSGSQSGVTRQLDRDAQARSWGNSQANRSSSANRSYSGSRASSSRSSGGSRSRSGGGGRRR